jgi:hypothetical protein
MMTARGIFNAAQHQDEDYEKAIDAGCNHFYREM